MEVVSKTLPCGCIQESNKMGENEVASYVAKYCKNHEPKEAFQNEEPQGQAQAQQQVQEIQEGFFSNPNNYLYIAAVVLLIVIGAVYFAYTNDLISMDFLSVAKDAIAGATSSTSS